jgi:hypothetical protein
MERDGPASSFDDARFRALHVGTVSKRRAIDHASHASVNVVPSRRTEDEVERSSGFDDERSVGLFAANLHRPER